MAGTCEAVTSELILAIGLLLLGTERGVLALRNLLFPLVPGTVALDRAAAGEHHFGILFLAEAGHQRGRVLEALAVRGEDLGQEVDVAAELQHLVVIPGHDGLLLVLGHRPFVEIGALIAEKPLAVLALHQRHAELVQVVAHPRLLGVEDNGAGDVAVVVVRVGHV